MLNTEQQIWKSIKTAYQIALSGIQGRLAGFADVDDPDYEYDTHRDLQAAERILNEQVANAQEELEARG